MRGQRREIVVALRHTLAMSSSTEVSAHERILTERARYVSAGVSIPKLVVSRADGARVTDVDGRTFIDFAGGIGCQNTGHRFAPVVDAIKAQADDYLHQCFMVGVYEPYVEVCRRLAELSPCRGAEQKSILLNSGAEAVENAVKIARTATGRPAVVVFDNAFHGRTLLAMTMTAKVVPYKRGFGPFAPEVYRAPAPYPFRGISEDDALAALKRLFKGEVDPEAVACAVLEPVQGEGGFIPMTTDFPKRLQELLDSYGILYVDDEVQSGCGRTGPVWAIEHYGIEPDLLVAGKTLGGGLPLASVSGRAEVMDAVEPGGLGGAFGGNPVACVAALAILEAVEGTRARAEEIARRVRARLEAMAPDGGEVRGLGPMLALELPEQTGDETTRITREARERGLVLLSCGLYGNVIRISSRSRSRTRTSRADWTSCRSALDADVAVEGIRKAYGDVVAVHDLDLRVGDGEFFTLLGPSGSGKTTTLRLIAGFERPDAGRIRLGGDDITNRPPYVRNVNTVFQDYALFPHMSVSENVGYGLKVKGVKRSDRNAQVREVLKMVRLDGYGDRKPVQLSGGQRQRVALARSIVNRPKV